MSEHPQSFPKQNHLRSSADFARTYDRKCKASTEHVLVFGAFNGLEVTRCGLSVSKKNGDAVDRNKIKRRMREAFRQERAALPVGLDLILIPKNGTASTVVDYRSALRVLCPKLIQKLTAAAS